jgi:hypothetical protein
VGAAAPVVAGAGAGVGAAAVSAIFGGVECKGQYICFMSKGRIACAEWVEWSRDWEVVSVRSQ